MLVRHCLKFSAIHYLGNDNLIIKTSLLKNMPPQTSTDTGLILTSVRVPVSFSVLNSRQTISCSSDKSQAI